MEAPPLSNTPVIATGAGFAIRAVARGIDAVYGVIVGLVGGVLAGILIVFLEQEELIAPGWEQRLGGFNLAGWISALIGSFIYQCLTEGIYGASLGKLSCGLRVVSEEGEPIAFTQALKRSLAYYWDALFFGLIGYSSMKQSELNQRYGDHWAKTVVVKSRDVPVGSRRDWILFALAFVVGSVLKMMCMAIGVIMHVQ